MHLEYLEKDLLLPKPFSFENPHTLHRPLIYIIQYLPFLIPLCQCSFSMKLLDAKDSGGAKIKPTLLVFSVECFDTPLATVCYVLVFLDMKDFM